MTGLDVYRPYGIAWPTRYPARIARQMSEGRRYAIVALLALLRPMILEIFP
ncbi:MAG TPA: hypothetical protein VFY28_00590 [Candidatus Paceibacterota bacterium]|nr:hypothetical protein [Candidatus Paceibacterota bacterium]